MKNKRSKTLLPLYYSERALKRQHTDAHALRRIPLSPASLFVADGDGPTVFGTTLILLGGRNQIHNQVNFLIAKE